jgi:hypothetical protein
MGAFFVAHADNAVIIVFGCCHRLFSFCICGPIQPASGNKTRRESCSTVWLPAMSFALFYACCLFLYICVRSTQMYTTIFVLVQMPCAYF